MLPFFIIVLILSLSVVAQVKYGSRPSSSTSRIMPTLKLTRLIFLTYIVVFITPKEALKITLQVIRVNISIPLLTM